MVQKLTTNRSGVAPHILYPTLFLRLATLALSLALLGIYGQDLAAANRAHIPADSRWVYAEVFAAFSATTAIIYMLPWCWGKTYKVWFWDAVLFVLGTASFAVHAELTVNARCYGGWCPERLRAGTWVGLVVMLMWFASAVVGGIVWYRMRHSRSTFTGRAVVV